jgi:hypothetical protein
MNLGLEEGKIADMESVSAKNIVLKNDILKNTLHGVTFHEKEVLNIINELYEKQ